METSIEKVSDSSTNKPDKEQNEEMDMKNISTLFFLNFLTALDTMDFGLPAAFFPYLAEEKFGFGSIFTSAVFATFPLFYFLGHTYISKWIMNFDRKRVLILVILVGSFSKLAFGCLEFVEDRYLFAIIAFLCRIFVGLTSAINLSIILSIIIDLWPEDKIKKVALFDTLNTVGNAAGPWVGAFFYYFGGFFCVFAMSALLTLLFGCAIVVYVIVKKFTIVDNTLDFFKGISNINVIMNFLLITFLYGSCCFIAPAFENHMILDLGLQPVTSSLIYGLHMVGCVISLLLINCFYNEKYRRMTIFLGGFFNIICEFFLGPEALLGIDDKTSQIIVIGFAMISLGMANGMTIVLIMQDFHDAYNEMFSNEEELSRNMANSIYLASFGSAEFFGVVCGGIMINYFGYARANSI